MSIESKSRGAHREAPETKETRPSIEMSEAALASFDIVAEKIKNAEGKSVCIVVRCWNKSAEDLVALKARIEKLQKKIPEISGVFISINKNDDTTNTQKHTLDVSDDELTFVPVEVEKYSWTAGLNAPIELLSQREDIPQDRVDIFNVSFDIEFDDEEIEKLAQRIHDGKTIIMRREQSPKELAEEGPLRTDKDVAQKVRELLRKGENIEEDFAAFLEQWHKDLVSLGRNTSSIFSLEDVKRLGGFNPACNEWGGMEDQEFGSRLLLDLARRLRDDDIRIDVKRKIQGEIARWLRAMVEPIYFSDPGWDSREKESRDFKYGHETKSIATVTKKLNEAFRSGASMVIPESQRDFPL